MRNLWGCQATASASLQQPHVEKRIETTLLNGIAWLVCVICSTLIEAWPIISDGKVTHRLNRSVKEIMIHRNQQFSTVGSISVTIVVDSKSSVTMYHHKFTDHKSQFRCPSSVVQYVTLSVMSSTEFRRSCCVIICQ